MSAYLGIDTSNYTTSIALIDGLGNVLFDKRIVLTVKPGELGLRQSDAFYQHVMNLPGLFFDLEDQLLNQIDCIGVSIRPRNIDGSYMPVFNAGYQFAKVMAKSLGKSIHECSHQDGHIMAGLPVGAEFVNRKLLNLHISGGTTELFISEWNCQKGIFSSEIVGGTKDISIGQLIDRLGVLLGFQFPCGAAMDASIENYIPEPSIEKISLPLKIQDPHFNLSGIENKLKQLYQSGLSPESLIYILFRDLGIMLRKLLESCILRHQPDQLILAGGVMSNSLIRRELQKLERRHSGLTIYQTPTAYCTDNAVGVARMAMLSKQKG